MGSQQAIKSLAVTSVVLYQSGRGRGSDTGAGIGASFGEGLGETLGEDAGDEQERLLCPSCLQMVQGMAWLAYK